LISLIPSCEGLISIEEDHVTCDSSVRIYSQAVSNKHPPGGRALAATHWHEWIIWLHSFTSRWQG
jgi:hypothetical protein